MRLRLKQAVESYLKVLGVANPEVFVKSAGDEAALIENANPLLSQLDFGRRNLRFGLALSGRHI